MDIESEIKAQLVGGSEWHCRSSHVAQINMLRAEDARSPSLRSSIEILQACRSFLAHRVLSSHVMLWGGVLLLVLNDLVP
jgi:hypothetical protein